ncbi:MAG: hypothetical protein ABR909_06120 [Candidatus Bathyarchaeia archaeon]
MEKAQAGYTGKWKSTLLRLLGIEIDASAIGTETAESIRANFTNNIMVGYPIDSIGLSLHNWRIIYCREPIVLCA